MWYIIKKKKERRWTAYKVEGQLPELKRGYEAKGPYDNLIHAMIAANGGEDVLPKQMRRETS